MKGRIGFRGYYRRGLFHESAVEVRQERRLKANKGFGERVGGFGERDDVLLILWRLWRCCATVAESYTVLGTARPSIMSSRLPPPSILASRHVALISFTATMHVPLSFQPHTLLVHIFRPRTSKTLSSRCLD